jgi:hypothetical protein
MVMLTKAVGRAVAAEPGPGRFKLPDGSRSIESPWVWRGFLFMAFIAFGLCLSFAVAGEGLFAAAWAVITAGWFGTSMWLWRKHVRADNEAWQARQRDRRRG